MDPNNTGCLFLCLAWFLFFPAVSGATNSFESVPDLHRTMYNVLDAYPCVRLLNLTGEIGCANPGRDKVVAPVVKYDGAVIILQSSTILVSMDQLQNFFHRLAKDLEFARNVGGVLVEWSADSMNELQGFSPDEKFPQERFAPYNSSNYEWNPKGSGIMWRSYPFPIFLLSENSTSTLKEVVSRNEKHKKTSNIDVAELHLVMQTTKSGTHDSKTCLEAGTCLPLGGYSVWTSYPPINVSSESSKPVILTVASMDTTSLFRDKSPGAESSISGLAALLAAVDALSRTVDFKHFKKQLVFAVFTGESWGYLGSRRFLHELDLHTDAVKGLNSSLIETVLEIGSIGKGYHNGSNTFYAHKTGDSGTMNGTFDALQHAQKSLKSSRIDVSTAKASNPGIPPSSMMTFLHKNSNMSGIVLEDFDSEFTNSYYHSHLDDISNVNSKSVAAAASLVARALLVLARNSTDLSTSDLSSINVNASLVEELLDCLVNCDPGLTCELVKNYISASSKCPGNYVGVVARDPSSSPYPGLSSDVARFVWNFLAEKTSTKRANADSTCKQGCDDAVGEVCVKAETDADGKGTCVQSTTRYVPAYSTRLKYGGGSWTLLPPNSSNPMEVVDPVWTESNWDTLGIQIYTRQEATYDLLIFVLGSVITVFSYTFIVTTKSCIAKVLKQD